MKPEQILQSNYLDILFDNRNKQYGAYTLRRDYQSRMLKALSTMLLLVLALCLFFKINGNSDSTAMLPEIFIEDVNLEPPPQKFPERKPMEEQRTSPTQKAVAQIDNVTPVVVPDILANKPIHTQEELNENVMIGTSAIPGVEYNGAPPAEVNGELNLTDPAPAKIVVPEVTKPIYNPDVMPEFPGGKNGLLKFMLRYLREPDYLEAGEKIVIMVKFVVGIDGSITHAEIIKSGGTFDADVLKVVNKMPRWKPGIQNGRAVPVYFQMPVTFQGSEQ